MPRRSFSTQPNGTLLFSISASRYSRTLMLGNRLLLFRPALPDGTLGVCQVLPGALKPPLIRAINGMAQGQQRATEYGCWRRLITVLLRSLCAGSPCVHRGTFGSIKKVNQGVHVCSRFRRMFVYSVISVFASHAVFSECMHCSKSFQARQQLSLTFFKRLLFRRFA